MMTVKAPPREWVRASEAPDADERPDDSILPLDPATSGAHGVPDLTGSGDFRTIVALSDQQVIPPLMPVSIGSGETKLMGATLVKRDVGPATRIATEMYYDNCPFTGSYPGAQGATWDNGSSAFADWATAQGTLNTGFATRGLVPFQIWVNSHVGFVVRGYYSVDFVS